MSTLEQAVARAVERLAIDGITGWGLAAPDGWDSVVVGAVRGCESETCNHHSHDAAAGSFTIFPLTGRLMLLGLDDTSWFAVVDGDDTTFWRSSSPLHYHDRLHKMAVEDVPEYLLAELAS